MMDDGPGFRKSGRNFFPLGVSLSFAEASFDAPLFLMKTVFLLPHRVKPSARPSPTVPLFPASGLPSLFEKARSSFFSNDFDIF